MNKKAILQYLNYQGEADANTNQLIEECIHEVKEIAYFKIIHQEMTLTHQPLMIRELNLEIKSEDLEFYFQDCHQCLILACTLGREIDRKIRYYEHINMTKAIVFDAVSSRYLEECCDQFEKQLQLGPHTFRFAPGYGDLTIEYNSILGKYLQIDKKLGVYVENGGTFLPMKTMLGIVGIGKNYQKTCLSCIRKEKCELRRGGLRCYVKD